MSSALSPVIVCFRPYLAAINSRSEHMSRAAASGQTVLLPCRLPGTNNKDWQYRGQHEQSHRNITKNGVVSSKFAHRFQQDANGLIIRDVQTKDQGTYTCINSHHHRQRQIHLFVPCKLASYCLQRSTCHVVLVTTTANDMEAQNHPQIYF